MDPDSIGDEGVAAADGNDAENGGGMDADDDQDATDDNADQADDDDEPSEDEDPDDKDDPEDDPEDEDGANQEETPLERQLRHLQGHLRGLTDRLHRPERTPRPNLDAAQLEEHRERAATIELNTQTQALQHQLSEMRQHQSVSLAEADRRNQQELDTIRRQKIFAGCTYQQSKQLSDMAPAAKSVYRCLDPQERSARRDQLFADTDRKQYGKALLKKSDKLLGLTT